MMNFIEKIKKRSHFDSKTRNGLFPGKGLACPPKRTPKGYFCPAGQDVYR